MARKQYPPTSVFAGSRVRFDTASGTTSPADIQLMDGTTVAGSILTADNGGRLPSVLGPDGVATLYRKTLDSFGAVVGQPVPLNAYDLTSTPQRSALAVDGGSP